MANLRRMMIASLVRMRWATSQYADMTDEEAEIEFYEMGDSQLLDVYDESKANYRDAINDRYES